MMTGRSVVRLCGATKRQGDKAPCKRPAGWGTSHVGFGTCKLHGGSTLSSSKHAAKLERTWRDTIADELDPSLSVIRRIRDGEDVPDRERLKAATYFVDKAIELAEGTGSGLKVTWEIRF